MERKKKDLIAEVIFTGTELLLGQILNTNAQYLQQTLAALGLDLYYQVTVGDNLKRCARAIRQAAGRADLIIIGGGLGPTEDDISREALGEALAIPLVRDPAALSVVERFFVSRGIPMSANNLKQALVPLNGLVLDNPIGTAPGVALEHKNKLYFLLPGPPAEFARMLDGQVVPYLRRHLADHSDIICSRVLKLCGIGESTLDESLSDLLKSKNPTLAPCAKEGEIHLRLTAKAPDEAVARQMIAGLEAALRLRLERYIYGADDDTLPGVVGRLLARNGWRVALAEEFTGGLLAHMLSTDPVAGEALSGGMVLTGQALKNNSTGLPLNIFPLAGVGGKEAAGQMAAAVRRIFTGSDIGIAVLESNKPHAQPGDQFPVYIATDFAGTCREKELLLWGSRSQAARRAADAALILLWRSCKKATALD